MPAKTRRKYEGNAVATTITSNLGNAVGDTSISVQAATGWPSSGPFYVVIDPGTASEEKMLVGSISGTALSSITRGVDGTSRVSHSSGASIYPVFTAVDADEANELTSKYTTRGDMVYQGASTFETLAKGTQHHVLKQGANDPAWGFVTNDNVDSSAAIALSKLATGALPTAITVASANIVNDTIVDADINSAAAISLSKLATGALPTAITVAKANLVSALQELLVPTGTVSPYAGTTAPSGWLLCFGQELAIATYGDLYSVCGTTYGALTNGSGGAGSTHFRAPDLRGRVAAGQDDMGGTSANRLTNPASTLNGIDGDVLGGTGGSETHTLTTAQLASHQHGWVYTTATGGTASGSGVPSHNQVTAGSGATDSAGSGTAHNNVQPTIILNYIIKT